jgi:hypothetical protein
MSFNLLNTMFKRTGRGAEPRSGRDGPIQPVQIYAFSDVRQHIPAGSNESVELTSDHPRKINCFPYRQVKFSYLWVIIDSRHYPVMISARME